MRNNAKINCQSDNSKGKPRRLVRLNCRCASHGRTGVLLLVARVVFRTASLSFDPRSPACQYCHGNTPAFIHSTEDSFKFGVAQAIMKGQIAFSTLLRRLKNLALASEDLVWRENLGLRGLSGLPVRFDLPGDEFAASRLALVRE